MDSLSSQIRETSVFHAKDTEPEQSAVPVFPWVVDALWSEQDLVDPSSV